MPKRIASTRHPCRVLVGPELRKRSRCRHPFGADRKPTRNRNTAKDSQSQAKPLTRSGSSSEDRQNHRALAPDIVGNHAPDHAADRQPSRVSAITVPA